MKNLILILFTLLLTPSFAQQEGVVVVTIFDSKSKKPLPFIKFKIKETDQLGKTNIDGKYTIDKLNYGSYTLIVSDTNYFFKTVAFNISSVNSIIEFTLTKNNAVLGPITVYNEKSESTFRIMRPIEGVLITRGKSPKVI